MAGTDVLHASAASPKVLYSGQLADASDHSLYGPAAGASAVIKSAVACNVSVAAITLTIRVIPSGGSVDGSHAVASAIPIAAGDSTVIEELVGCCLGPGDSVHAQASAGTAVDVVLSGVEYT